MVEVEHITASTLAQGRFDEHPFGYDEDSARDPSWGPLIALLFIAVVCISAWLTSNKRR